MKGPSFPRQLAEGEIDFAFLPFLHRASMNEHHEPPVEELPRPLVSAMQLGPNGFEIWGSQRESWSRVVNPLVGLIQRRRPSVEDVIITASLALEARGHMLPPNANEPIYGTAGMSRNPSFRAYVLRCLHSLAVDWSPIAPSAEALASAISAAYNGVKHPEREMLDLLDLALLGRVEIWIVRLCVMTMFEAIPNVVEFAKSHEGFADALRAFEWNNRFISGRGTFEDRS